MASLKVIHARNPSFLGTQYTKIKSARKICTRTLFIGGFLIPDISAVGFLVNEKIGNVCYDAGHTFIGPIILGGLALIGAQYGLLAAALIWSAHILGDRTLGFGLRY